MGFACLLGMRYLITFFALFTLAVPDLRAQADRLELGYQTTRRGVVWYRSGLPTYNPAWRFSRDTNAVMWVDTLTAIRYDWDYSDDVWRAKGTFSGALPPVPVQASGAANLDNRSAFWIRDTFSLLHKYDSTANAWTPIGDFLYLSTVPTEITATGTNGAAKYRRSLWQDSDDNKLYYWDGATWTEVGGDLSITNEIQTISAGGAGPTSYTIDLDLGGGSVTLQEGSNIDLTRSGNTITVASTASGGITVAESGLHLSSGKVRFGSSGGNPLLTTTSLDIDNNAFWFGDGQMSMFRYSNNPPTPRYTFGVQGIISLPGISTPAEDAVFSIMGHNVGNGTNNANALHFGTYPTVTDGSWIQARSMLAYGTRYPLSLQPRGGQLSVGRIGGLDALVTFAGTGLSGSTISGSVLHLENNEGNGKAAMSMGIGTDILDSEVAWFDATDALRLTNRSSVNGTSSIRFAIGGETNDLATLVKSSNATSLVRLGVGVGNPANIHSTVQSAGSFSARPLTTVGSFTLDESNYLVIYTANSTVTWTLPTASTCPGRQYVLCNRGSSGTVNLSASVSKGAGGNFSSLSAGQWAIIFSDGSSWTGFKLTSL